MNPSSRQGSPVAGSARGYVLVILAVLFWSGSASLAKFLFTKNFDTLIVSQTRTSLSFILLALIFAAVDRSIFRVRLRDLPQFALLGIVGYAITNFTYYFTVQHSTVATAIIIQYTAPVMVMLYAVAVVREERFSLPKASAMTLSLIGCFLAVSGGDLAAVNLSGWTLVTGPLSAVTYSLLLIQTKHLLKCYRVWTILVYALAFAALFWIVVNPPWAIAARGYTAADWGVLWVFAIVSIMLPNALFSAGLKLLDASTVGILSTTEPIAAILFAYATLGEALTPVQIGGAAIVFAALLILQLRSTPEPLEPTA